LRQSGRRSERRRRTRMRMRSITRMRRRKRSRMTWMQAMLGEEAVLWWRRQGWKGKELIRW
jgi:hypothetical protein